MNNSVLQKIKYIQDKWKRISYEIDNDKKLKRDYIQQRINTLEQSIIKTNNNDINRLQDAVTKLTEQSLNFNDTIDQQQCNKLSQQINLIPLIAQQEQELLEKRLSNSFDDSCFKLGDQIDRNHSQYQFGLEHKVALINDSINQIEMAMSREREERQQTLDEIQSALDQHLHQLQDHIVVEQQVRRETESKIFEMIQDVHKNLQEMVVQEQKDRKLMTESLMNLMDDACIRIDKNLNS